MKKTGGDAITCLLLDIGGVLHTGFESTCEQLALLGLGTCERVTLGSQNAWALPGSER